VCVSVRVTAVASPYAQKRCPQSSSASSRGRRASLSTHMNRADNDHVRLVLGLGQRVRLPMVRTSSDMNLNSTSFLQGTRKRL